MSVATNSRLKKIVVQLTGSIAFYPAIIAIAFLLVFWGMVTFDQTATGKNIKATWHWLRMKDAATARLVAATIAGGMLSFTVFSFSMVMIVLNQTASKMSNRILEIIIRNRFQQIVLGCYIGTVIYSIFLVTVIRDTDTGVYVPALSTYLLIVFAIMDIFLFIYFLHFVTQYAKYQTIIHHIHSKTLSRLQHEIKNKQAAPARTYAFEQNLCSKKTGYFEGGDEKKLLSLSTSGVYQIVYLLPVGSFVLKGNTFLRIKSSQPLSPEILAQIAASVDVSEQPFFSYFLSGFSQLTEVAMKALSPGINDPATAVISLQAMADLFCWFFNHPLPSSQVSSDGERILSYTIPPIEELLEMYLLPVWDYGKEDRTVQKAIADLLRQLLTLSNEEKISNWLAQFLVEVKEHSEKMFKPLP